MTKYFLIIASLIIIIGALIKADNEKAMESCMRTHSFDTCFYTLHH